MMSNPLKAPATQLAPSAKTTQTPATQLAKTTQAPAPTALAEAGPRPGARLVPAPHPGPPARSARPGSGPRLGKSGIDPSHATLMHYPFIQRIARRLSRRVPTYLALDDVVAAGVVGLMESIDRYNPRLSPSFNSFAEVRIRGAILDTLRDCDHLSRDQRACLDEVKKVRQRLLAKHGREPDPAELADAMGCQLERFYELTSRAASRRFQRVTSRLTTTDLLQPQGSALWADPQRAVLRFEVREAMKYLPDRLWLVVKMHYFDQMKLREIAAEFRLTESRICQIHGEAMALLREHLKD